MTAPRHHRVDHIRGKCNRDESSTVSGIRAIECVGRDACDRATKNRKATWNLCNVVGIAEYLVFAFGDVRVQRNWKGIFGHKITTRHARAGIIVHALSSIIVGQVIKRVFAVLCRVIRDRKSIGCSDYKFGYS